MSDQRAGVAFGLAAFGWWGLAPFYFHALARVSPWEILAHRIVGSLLLLLVYQALGRRMAALRALLRDRRTLGLLAASTLLVSTNWMLFIWSIATGRLLDASFGYFVNPLVNVLLGFLLLGERFSRRQGLSLLLALVGVLVLGIGYRRPPWISLTLALSFGGYGLLRKRARTGAVAGLTVETLLATPFALAYLLWLEHAGHLAFGHVGAGSTWLLCAAGVITALPLLWFVAAARRLRYATVGLLQYVAPTLQFLVAVLAFGESFTHTHAVSFGLIWCALGLYSWDSLRPRHRVVIA